MSNVSIDVQESAKKIAANLYPTMARTCLTLFITDETGAVTEFSLWADDPGMIELFGKFHALCTPVTVGGGEIEAAVGSEAIQP